MRDEFLIISNKIRFIIDVIEGHILIMNKKMKEIEDKLVERGFDKYEDSYNYLLQMPIYQLTAEKKEKLEMEVAKLKEEIEKLEKTSIIDIWENELTVLLEEWENHKKEVLEDYENDLKGDTKTSKKQVKGKK